MVATRVGFTGEIIWDTTKPNGQPRRCLDINRAKELFEFRTQNRLQDGIHKTVDWFMQNRHQVREVTFV